MKMQLIKKNDFEKLIAVCWMMLFAIWGYVAISGNYFEIVVANPTIIKICDFIDNNFILNNLVRFIMYYLNWIFVVYAILRERLFKYKPILISLSIFAVWLVKTIFINIEIFNYTDAIMFIALAIVCKRKWYRSLIGAVLTFVFAFVSSFIKQVFIPNVDFNTLPILIALVFSIDIYLLTFIYYICVLYRKEKNYGQLFNLVQIKQKVENYFISIGNSFISIFRRNRNVTIISSMFKSCSMLKTIPQLDTSNVTNMSSMFNGCSALETIPQLDMIKVSNASSMFYNCSKLTNLTLLNIKVNLDLSPSEKLTLESLINTVKEFINVGSARILTMGTANLEKIASTYVKFTDSSVTTIPTNEKGDVVVCESTDEGAMLLKDYALLKNWTLA